MHMLPCHFLSSSKPLYVRIQVRKIRYWLLLAFSLHRRVWRIWNFTCIWNVSYIWSTLAYEIKRGVITGLPNIIRHLLHMCFTCYKDPKVKYMNRKVSHMTNANKSKGHMSYGSRHITCYLLSDKPMAVFVQQGQYNNKVDFAFALALYTLWIWMIDQIFTMIISSANLLLLVYLLSD